MSSEFKFTAENEERFQDILSRYPQKRAAMLPTLHLAQEQNGYISPEVEAYVSELLEVPLVDVHEVLSFYTLYFQKPPGEHHIRVCCSFSCWMRGSDQVTEKVREVLGVEENEVTEDGAFSWEAVPDCLGACEMAPMMQLDGYFEDNLTGEKVEQVIGRVRNQK